MTHPATDAIVLEGKQVAFTGRLASMTRKEAVQLVRSHGGRFVPEVSRNTSYLIVGQEGWPLSSDGRLTNKLRKARLLQRRGIDVCVCAEDDFLTRLGLNPSPDRRLYDAAELTRLLDIPRDRLRAWINAGLIRPAETRHGVGYFDFPQVTGAKTLCELVKAGASIKRIRQSLEHLKAWTAVSTPLEQLAVLEKDGSLVVRVEEGLADAKGQLLFEFTDEGKPTGCGPWEAVSFTPPSLTDAEWFDRACAHETAGRLTEAEHAYRQALLAGGPDPVCCFNLGNVLYQLNRKPEAAERFYQTVELAPTDAAAWNNLGVVLCDLNRFDEAKAAYLKAASLGHADAHYNLADLLADGGQQDQARSHWQAYLQNDPNSRWAAYARTKLRQSS